MKMFEVKVPVPLYLIRHGKAEYSRLFEDRGLVDVHGQLSKEGKEQVEKSAQELGQELQSRNIMQVLLVTSPKRRCWQSAEILLANLKAALSIKLQVDDGFRDVDVILNSPQRPNGGSYGDWEENLPEGENWMFGWKRKQQYFVGEESPSQLAERVPAAFASVILSLAIDKEAIIIVCHEEVMLGLAEYFGVVVKTGRPHYAQIWKFATV